MSQPLFFDPPTAFTRRVQELAKQPGMTAVSARLLLNVELTFALAEALGFDDEPVTAPWALLSGMLLREVRLQRLTPAQRLALANVRQIVPYGPRFAWQTALQDYLGLPQMLRSYDFTLGGTQATIISNARKPNAERHALHTSIYQACLTERLPWRRRAPLPPVQAAHEYAFRALALGANNQPLSAQLNVRFGEELLQTLAAECSPRMAEPRLKTGLTVSRAQLTAVADWLDQREQALQLRFGYEPQRWGRRLQHVQLQQVQGQDLSATEELTIEGFTHVAGMVASGKSTISLLLAAHLVQAEPPRRLTLVVGDVQSAVHLANQINQWFRDDPASEAPVAVPLLGRSNRAEHIQAFQASLEYLRYYERQQAHWGERWLSPLCPLQACVSDTEIQRRLEGRLIKVGKEPCQTLRKVKMEDGPTSPRRRRTLPAEAENRGKRHGCPFLPVCPQYQLYRDMPTAQVWVTTPGAMSGGSLPLFLEDRPLKLGEFIHEHSDVVIFDEADTIIKWFDDQHAQELPLTGGRAGILDAITLPTERHAVNTRVMPSGTLRWVGAERNAQQAVTSVLTLLHTAYGPGFLHEWVAGHQFTPWSLFYRLARLIAGLPEFDATDTPVEERRRRDELTESVQQHFRALLEPSDVLRPPVSTPEPPAPAVRHLSLILQRINNTGENATDADIHAECLNWLTEHCPTAQQAEDSPAHLAYRLQFALTVALLDRHTRIVFYDWDNRPADIQDGSPNHRHRAAIQSLLPLPLTGRQFGTYYARGLPGPEQGGASEQALSMFAYTNVGRYYVLHFHELLTDLTGQPGPAVLALSGTSYLEASTAFHVGRPQALLRPAEEAKAAIRQSRFAYLPQYTPDEKPIRLSGLRQRDKPSAIQQLVAGLVGRAGRGHLGQMLEELAQLGAQYPDWWHDRARLLLFVNSYEQAGWAADAIRRAWPALQHRVRHLVAGKQEQLPDGAVRRSDVEQFALTDGQILVAPLNAVGRGFNMLNAAGKAAFGAVYFLTRPYPQPHDVQAVAREVNRRTLDWLADASFGAWQADGLQGKAEAARREAVRYWQLAEGRAYYRTLRPHPELRSFPRQDLAATTVGYIIQAVGRLVRGGVPFRAFFVDAAWGPEWAKKLERQPDTPATSLLAAMIELINDYVAEDLISRELYEPLATALDEIVHFEWRPEPLKNL